MDLFQCDLKCISYIPAHLTLWFATEKKATRIISLSFLIWSWVYGGIGGMQIGGNVGNLGGNANIWQPPRANLHLRRLGKAACRSSPKKTQWDMFWKTKYMSSVLRHTLWVIASLTFPILSDKSHKIWNIHKHLEKYSVPIKENMHCISREIFIVYLEKCLLLYI